jgi:rhodanese-related sulfurtransferase
MSDSLNSIPLRHTAELTQALRNGQEVAIVDLREEADFGTGHPLFATNLPLSKLEIEVLDRIPRRSTAITLYDNGQCYNPRTGTRLAEVAYQRLKALGYVDVALLAGDLAGWKEAGGEVFTDLNSQSKAFAAWAEYHHQPSAPQESAPEIAREWAARTGAQQIDLAQFIQWQADGQRTLYLFDVRSPEEFQAGHLPGARNVPGDRLTQSIDQFASVRGARVVLIDNDGVRANLAASRLAQLNWDAFVLADGGKPEALFTESGNGTVTSAPVPAIESIDGQQLQQWLEEGETGIVDLTLSANFRNRRIPGAVFTARSQLPQTLSQRPAYKRWVVTCGSGFLARYAVTEVAELTGSPTYLLHGGTLKWIDEQRPLEHGDSPYLQNPRDKYLRQHEQDDASPEAIQAYQDWEKGLVAQLERDDTHGFRLI